MDKKSRKKKEREERKRQQQKQSARSPFDKLLSPPKNLRAVINADWQETFMADIIVRRDLGDDLLAIGFFSLSLDVSGLQAVSGYLDATEAEWSDALADYAEHGKMMPVDPAPLRALIEGAARIASENGLRLPDKWDKWLRIFGSPPDIASADLRNFSKAYYGPLSELKDRLTGYTLEAFLARTDIDVNPEDDLGLFPEWGQTPEPDLTSLDANHPTGDPLLDALTALGETPHPDLELAMKFHHTAAQAAAADLLRDFSLTLTDAPMYRASLESQIAALGPDQHAGLRAAIAQYHRYLAHAASTSD